MAKSKLVDIQRPVQFVRPDGSVASYQRGLQNVDATPYKGDDGKPNGPKNAKSDAEHWMLQQPENAVFPNGDGKPSDADDEVADGNGGQDGGVAAAPASGSARGTAPGVTAATDLTDQSVTDKTPKK